MAVEARQILRLKRSSVFMDFQRNYESFNNTHSPKLERTWQDEPLSNKERRELAEDLRKVWGLADSAVHAGVTEKDADHIREKLGVAFLIAKVSRVSILAALTVDNKKPVGKHSFGDMLVDAAMDFEPVLYR